jgi:hypothetical protein
MFCQSEVNPVVYVATIFATEDVMDMPGTIEPEPILLKASDLNSLGTRN